VEHTASDRAATSDPASKGKAPGKHSVAEKSTAKKSTAKKPTAKKPAATTSTARQSTALAEYNRKRDFSRTKEPAGTVPVTRGRTLRFVIQKHAASHLHFDFRLELDGVMKSWAVPRGPSYDPAVRRLAMEVEDHPISYNTFEGTIPEGEYGGGTVMLWDRGTYEAEDGGGRASLRRGLADGDLRITMYGERMRGGWVLVRMKRPGRPQWLLIKHRDEDADAEYDVIERFSKSVTTGRSMEQIGRTGRVWKASR
jgi:bifunctional non-homologous end joining protein LigD